jgi:predicted MFS family arabinose efflux permease
MKSSLLAAEPNSDSPGESRSRDSPAIAAPSIRPPWSLYGPLQRWGYLGILFLVITSNYFDYYILSVLLEPIKREFRVSDTILGLLTGSSFAIVYGLTALPIARWADHGNRRTVMTVALVAWSIFTALCGWAQTFWQLAFYRFGVGAVEPGGVPPAQSLVTDYFPPERRGTAIAILTNGASAVGWLLGVGGGGLIGALYGWRTTFLLAGVSGLALALVVRFTLPEPRSAPAFVTGIRRSESVRSTLSSLSRKPTFLFALAGFSVYAIFAYGVTVFVPSFMIRSFHVSLEKVSVPWGCAIAASNVLGALAGGWLVDRLCRRDIRWYAWLPALACALAMPVYWLALTRDHLIPFIGAEFVAETMLSMGVPVIFVAVLAVCGAHRRALASAAVNCLTILIGGTFGPLIVGAASDALSYAYGDESLRYALISMCLFPLPAAALLYLSGRTIKRDKED